MKKKLRAVEGSVDEDIKEIEEADQFICAPYRLSKLY